MDYVKDGTLTIQARTIKEVNSIDRVVVYADGCQREYLMPLPMGVDELELYRYLVETSLKELEATRKNLQLVLNRINSQIEKGDTNDSNT